MRESEHSRAEHNSGHVIFLGTGDALNWERAQTSLALPLPDDEAMLIDASSGPVLLRQLEAAEISLESVRHLFISHLHFDHVGGLAPLLIAMAPLPGASLAVHGTPRTLKGLKELLALTIPGVENWLEGRLIWREFAPGESVRLNDAEITPFRVDHGPECVGFCVTHAGSVAVFTADTRPCPEVVEDAKGADLLIHEVYSLKYEAEQAHTLGHPTAAEAGRAAREAGAGRLVLTHLRASRFVDPKALAAEAEISFGHPVEVAGDLMASEFWAAGVPTAKELAARFGGISAMSGAQFEIFVADLFRAMGHRTTVMGRSGDQGVDVIVDHGGERVAVQCKNYKRRVGNKPVQEVYAGAKHHGCSRAWVVAPAGYTSGAQELAKSTGVSLFDAGGIRHWIRQVDEMEKQRKRAA